jgi:hypothetical protein
MLRIGSYNIEWFDELFNPDNTVKTGQKEQARISAIGQVLSEMDPDVLGICEAPNTKVSGTDRTEAKLEAFAAAVGIRANRAMTGIISAGRQELALLYDPQTITVAHDPGGAAGSRSNPPFDGTFYFDTDDDRIKEEYKFYRPPLEAKVQIVGTSTEFWLILVHTKSKGIFNSMDMVHFERESLRNRRKLFAECSWIRKRVDEWLDSGRQVVVMGDVNDGPGHDYYEATFGRSAVEIIMGDLFSPERVLKNLAGMPKWNAYGWTPSTARFEDPLIRQKTVNVLIDHVLVSQGLPLTAKPHRIWNPYVDANLAGLKPALTAASDHFPVTLDLA